MKDETILKQKKTSSPLPKDESSDWYPVGAFITGVLIFVSIWIYAISEWGLLLGLMFGWIPATIGGVVGGFLWPIIALIIVWIIISSR